MEKIFQFIILLGILYFGAIIHEIGHAWAAMRCGDYTAKHLGRITLNPVKHFHPIFTLVMPIVTFLLMGFPFGGMKPVPVNPRNFRDFNDFKKFRRDDIFVSVAGPAAEILFAFSLLFIFLLMSPFIHVKSWAATLFLWGFIIHIVIAFFNLIPIPPLDGSHVFQYLLPTDKRIAYMRIGNTFGMLFLIIFIYVGGTKILNPIFELCFDIFNWCYVNISLKALIA